MSITTAQADNVISLECVSAPLSLQRNEILVELTTFHAGISSTRLISTLKPVVRIHTQDSKWIHVIHFLDQDFVEFSDAYRWCEQYRQFGTFGAVCISCVSVTVEGRLMSRSKPCIVVRLEGKQTMQLFRSCGAHFSTNTKRGVLLRYNDLVTKVSIPGRTRYSLRCSSHSQEWSLENHKRNRAAPSMTPTKRVKLDRSIPGVPHNEKRLNLLYVGVDVQAMVTADIASRILEAIRLTQAISVTATSMASGNNINEAHAAVLPWQRE